MSAVITSDIVAKHNIHIYVCDNKTCNPHSHSWLELAYVVEGTASHTLNGESSRLEKGNYFILDYAATHCYEAESDSFAVINCLFRPEFIDNSLKNCRTFSEVVNSYMLRHSHNRLNISPANYIFYDTDGQVLAHLEGMLNEYNRYAVGFLEIIRSKLIEIIILTMRKDNSNEIVTSDKLCDDMIAYAEKNLFEKDILTRISRKLNFSPAYLSRKFKEDTGLTFSCYIQRLRLETACRLLANTNKKMTEIAYLSGYSDVKFFGKIFKRHLGLSPRDFRKNLKKP